MLNTVLTAVGDVAALAAALFAFLALRQASETLADARNDRQEAERNRKRHRVEHVGEILEAMASATESAPHRFAVHRNRLGLGLASLRKQLPKCSALFDDANMPDQFKSLDISAARQEIDDTLISLSVAERDDAQRTSR